MYSFAKILLKISTALAAIIIVGSLLISIFFRDSHFGLAFPWVFISVIMLWVPISAVCLLALAITSPKGANVSMEIKVFKPIHWAISTFFLLLAVYLIFSHSSTITLLLQGTAVSSVRLTFLLFISVALAFVASLGVFLRRPWAKHFAFSLALVLLVYAVLGFAADLVISAVLALASYFYLRRESTV